MGIRGIPRDVETFEAFNREYESSRFRFAESNRRIGSATVDLLLSFFLPRWRFWLGRPVVRTPMDKPLLTAMGFAPAPGWLRALTPTLLRLRAQVLAYLPERRRPRLLTQAPRPTYPEGYQIEELSTFRRGARAGTETDRKSAITAAGRHLAAAQPQPFKCRGEAETGHPSPTSWLTAEDAERAAVGLIRSMLALTVLGSDELGSLV